MFTLLGNKFDMHFQERSQICSRLVKEEYFFQN